TGLHGRMRLRGVVVLAVLLSPGLGLAESRPQDPSRVRGTSFSIENGALKLPGPVLFEPGGDKLAPASDEVLAVASDYLVAKAYVTLLRIEVHTDSDGAPAANQALSERRALAVARWLIASGVSCGRLIAVGFGGSKPIAPNDTPANKALN